MTTIGIDISKKELVGVAINRNAQVKARYDIANRKVAVDNLLDTLQDRYKHIKVGSEATAEYHRLLALTCLDRNIPFYLINPITTKQFTRATVRKRKTDMSDALIIAKLLFQGEGRKMSKEDFQANKAILRTAVKLSNMYQSLSLVKRRFQNNYSQQTEVINIIDKCLQTIRDGIAQMRKQADTEDKELLTLLCSLPGIGRMNANTLIAEIGDIKRFKSSKRLIAYMGLDPKVKQSGTSLHHNTKLTKRGSPYLRRAMFTAAAVGIRYDQELKCYYQKKRREGRGYREAVIAASRKLVNRIYAVWKRNKPYVKVQA